MRLFQVVTSVFAACLLATPVLAQDAVNAAYEAALAESPTPVLLRLSQEDWARWWTEYPDERESMEETRVEELRATLARDRLVRADRLALAELARVCVKTGLQNCEIDNSGSLTLADGASIWFQQQTGHTDDDGVSTAMVVLAAEGDRLKPIFWLAGPLGVLPLETYRNTDGDEAGPTYVAVPAYGQGTGSQWMGSMFRWNGANAAPTEIDAQSWLIALDEALPEGLGVWKGPQFHWAWLSAESPLWQESDANCCATGGEVYVGLKIEGDALVADNVAVDDAILNVAMTVEPEVLNWVSRREHCEHWQGEEPYDDARRIEIAANVERLACDALGADEAVLRAAHAENASILALLNRAKAE
ncbi:hypothetical protein [Brevundimonas sp.]|uniref:hypothetical protein n=1 Tax=Brevundimonas sp. TaxID=1871086 RepID=UPI00286BBA0B|nr:hypothetical protein [Brevundimonas sp.]